MANKHISKGLFYRVWQRYNRVGDMVPKRGLEPPRGYPHMHLKHACLPISPLRQERRTLPIALDNVNLAMDFHNFI